VCKGGSPSADGLPHSKTSGMGCAQEIVVTSRGAADIEEHVRATLLTAPRRTPIPQQQCQKRGISQSGFGWLNARCLLDGGPDRRLSLVRPNSVRAAGLVGILLLREPVIADGESMRRGLRLSVGLLHADYFALADDFGMPVDSTGRRNFEAHIHHGRGFEDRFRAEKNARMADVFGSGLMPFRAVGDSIENWNFDLEAFCAV
jgi:hypothetical protein